MERRGGVADCGETLTELAPAELAAAHAPLTDPTWPTPHAFAHVLELAQAREPEALSLLYRRFLPVVYRFVLGRVKDVPLAEDLTSETFFAVMRGITTVRAQDELGFATWVLGIARNKLSQHFRERQHHLEVPLADSGAAEPVAHAEEDDPLQVLTARERWAEVVVALNRLTAEQRKVLLHRCILGQPTEEVARVMGKPANAVYGLQFRALASLARFLKHDEPPEPRAHDAPERSRERRDSHAT